MLALVVVIVGPIVRQGREGEVDVLAQGHVGLAVCVVDLVEPTSRIAQKNPTFRNRHLFDFREGDSGQWRWQEGAGVGGRGGVGGKGVRIITISESWHVLSDPQYKQKPIAILLTPTAAAKGNPTRAFSGYPLVELVQVHNTLTFKTAPLHREAAAKCTQHFDVTFL